MCVPPGGGKFQISFCGIDFILVEVSLHDPDMIQFRGSSHAVYRLEEKRRQLPYGQYGRLEQDDRRRVTQQCAH